MICPKCGANTSDGDNYCEDCGASLKKIRRTDNANGYNNDNLRSDIVKVDSSLAAASNIGRRHPTNEDAGTVLRCTDGSIIMIVADGVSSAVNAVSASKQAITKVKEVLSAGSGHGMDLLRSAINEANDIIIGLPYETREDGIYGPETTIVAAVVEDGMATIGWVGDSRAYILGSNTQSLLTRDDSWVELIVAAGEMDRREALLDKRAHYVTQVLGMHDQTMEIHLIQHVLEKNQMLLLCTDGLWNYFQGDEDILKAVADFGVEKDAAEICEHLVAMANNAGGHDNITAAILKYD